MYCLNKGKDPSSEKSDTVSPQTLGSLSGKSYSVLVQKLGPKKSEKAYPVFAQVLAFR